MGTNAIALGEGCFTRDCLHFFYSSVIRSFEIIIRRD